MGNKTFYEIAAVVALVCSLAALGAAIVPHLIGPIEEPVARSYTTGWYVEQGGDKAVVASGGELEVQSGGVLDVQSGATFDPVMSGATINGNQTITGTLDVYGNVSSSTGAFTVTDSMNITGAVDADSTFNADGAATFNSTVDIDGNVSSGTGAVTVTDSVNITGAVDCDSAFNADGAATFGSTADVASTLQFGADNLYPLGYATANYQIVCGTSGTFTETTAVSVSGLTTITYAIVTQITDPASTGALVTVDSPTTSTLTINSWETDATAGTTGVNVYYCAVGNQ